MARTHRMQWIAGSLALVLAGCMMTGDDDLGAEQDEGSEDYVGEAQQEVTGSPTAATPNWSVLLSTPVGRLHALRQERRVLPLGTFRHRS
jgi:hypothetical protein